MATRSETVKRALGIDPPSPDETPAETLARVRDEQSAEQPKNEVAVPTSWLTTEERRSIQSLNDIKALSDLHEVQMEYADQEIGDGFALLKDGAVLIGRYLILLEWHFAKGDFSKEFVAMHIVAPEKDGTVKKFIYNDGSTGIYAQLRQYTDKTGKQSGLIVRNGFRVSRYEYEADDGSKKNAYTYYLDTSA